MKNGYLIDPGFDAPVLLTPFQDPKSSTGWDMEEKFCWHVSETPQAGRMEELEAQTYSQIDRGIDRRIQDEKYFPRLFLSAGAFLAIYFVLSFAVRDPIPMIDELVAGIAGALGIWILMEKKAVKSDPSIKIRLEIKQRVSEAEVVIDPAVAAVESWLGNLRGENALQIADAMVRTAGSDLPPLEAVPADLAGLLDQRCALSMPRLHALLPRIREARKGEGPSSKSPGQKNPNRESPRNKNANRNIPSGKGANFHLNSRLVEALQKDPESVALLALLVKTEEISQQ